MAVPLAAVERNLDIQGTRIYTSRQLVDILDLNAFSRGGLTDLQVTERIMAFYRMKGYPLVRVYILEKSPVLLSIFVDEGRLGRIVILNTNTLELARIRYKLDLPGKIYHPATLERELKRIRDEYGYRDVTYRLKVVDDYRESEFQLDRELELPVLGKTFLPFFDRVGVRYDLEILVEKMPGAESGEKGYSYGLHTSYTKGLMPEVRYYRRDVIAERDRLKAATSLGVRYGYDLEFSRPPDITFYQIDMVYWFPPYYREYVTPKGSFLFYWSSASRSDLNINSYNYLQFREVLAPGLTLLKRFKVNTGFGDETVRILDSRIAEGGGTLYPVESETENLVFFELEASLNFIPLWPPTHRKKNLRLVYDRYFAGRSFHTLLIGLSVDYEPRKKHLYSLVAENWNLLGDVPFYHEVPVSGQAFRGFMGRSYHTHHGLFLGNRYLVSLYREYIQGGAYVDMAFFKGSGYDLRGFQPGMVAGPWLQFLILDQFVLDIALGRDLLFSNFSSQWNVYFDFQKRW